MYQQNNIEFRIASADAMLVAIDYAILMAKAKMK